MDDLEKDRLCMAAIGLWGISAQQSMVVEECSELIFTICKFNRGKKTAAEISEEIADCKIMFYQLMYMLGIPDIEVRAHEDIKWERLKHRIEKAQEEKHNRGRG